MNGIERESTIRWTKVCLIAVAVLLLFGVWFGNLEYRALMHPDEGRYAEVPRELLASGDWVTPRLNDLKYFEKPVLQYWMTALAYWAFGEHHWTARLYPAVTGLLGILLTFLAGSRLFGLQVGLCSSLILASSLLYIVGAQVLTLDMGLAFHLHLALVSFLLAQTSDTDKQCRSFMWLAWASMGLAVLSKGLLGIALPALALVSFSVWRRNWSHFRRLHLRSGILIFVLIVSPWFVAVSLANPTFPEFFFVREHFQRFASPEHHRPGPWWYFLPILALGFMPWLALLPAALQTRTSPGSHFDSRRFLLVWCLVIFVFFSASQSKLPFYILPMLPPLALLVAIGLEKLTDRQLAGRFALVTLFGLLMLVALCELSPKAALKFPAEALAAFVPWLLVAILWLMAFAVAGACLAWKHRRITAICTIAVGGLGFAQIIVTESNELAPVLSSYDIVRTIRHETQAFDPRVDFFNIEQYDQTLPFYLKRPVTLVNYAGELAMGIGLEPEKAIMNERDFLEHWRTLGQAYAILPLHELHEFEDAPFREVARDSKRIIIARR